MSLEEAFKVVETYAKDYEFNLVINFYTSKVFLLSRIDLKTICHMSVTIADTWQESIVKLATRVQDGLI
jgi:hypothetical protein